MQQIKLNEIKLSSRVRDEASDISQLSASFKEFGQIEPIVLGPDNSLVAGRRRMRAAAALGWDSIGFVYRDQLDPESAKALEIEENICREDFTDEEKIKAVLELHELRLKKYGEPTKTRPGWTLSDTAQCISLKKTQTALYVEVAKALPTSLGVMNALRQSGVTAAYKQLKYEEDNALHRELAKRAKAAPVVIPTAPPKSDKKEGSPTPAVAEPAVALSDFLVQCDCLEGIQAIPDSSQHIVFCDPPYGVGIDEIKNFGSFTGDHKYDDSEVSMLALMRQLMPELFRVTRTDGWIWMWTSLLTFWNLQDMMSRAGYKTCYVPFIWIKDRALHPSVDLDHRFANTYEVALYGWKGNPSMVKQGRPNYMIAKPPATDHHPHAKPIELQREMLSRFCNPGASVLDPFGGSFSVFKAALLAGMRCISFEKDTDYYSRGVVSVEQFIKGGMKP